MKPSNKRERHILELDKAIKPYPKAAEKWAYKTQLDHYAYLWHGSQSLCCMDCGHQWKSNLSNTIISQRGTITCPHCGKRLTVKVTNRKSCNVEATFSVLQVVGEYQVFRIIGAYGHSERGRRMERHCNELCRFYLDKNGRYCTTGLKTTYNNYLYDFCYGSSFELRCKPELFNVVSRCYPYPKMQLADFLVKRGVKPSTDPRLMRVEFLCELLTETHLETVLKMDRPGHCWYFYTNPIELQRYWPQYKIANRAHYEIPQDALGDWIDYIEALNEAHKDTCSPRYLCPKEPLPIIHARLIQQNRLRREAAEKERLRRTIGEREKLYAKNKAPYLDLQFSDGLITCHVLQNVNEFIDEASAMHHCVFDNRYDQKESCIILSARINDKRIETVEYSLIQHSVLQSRGKFNSQTDYHDRIVKLVEAHTPDIIKRQSLTL